LDPFDDGTGVIGGSGYVAGDIDFEQRPARQPPSVGELVRGNVVEVFG
jgi:hypothetical protein